MLKSKVTCWFCSEESSVFFMSKNSWTCQQCDQYNGFKKVKFDSLILNTNLSLFKQEIKYAIGR